MKKVLKFLGIVVLVVVLLLAVGGLFIQVRGIPSYDVPEVEYQAVATSESIARGKKLVNSLCTSCHRDPVTGKITGTHMKDAPKEFGTIYSMNITQDKESGIGNWTDAELLVLLRTGIKPDGSYAPPYMAKLPLMADEDINAIISYLRSDDPQVHPDPTPDKPCEPSFLTKFLCTVAFKPFPMPEEPIPMPDPNNKLALGEYLAHNLDCFSCHSADFKTNDFLQPTNSVGYFGGGNPIPDKDGNIIISANLTPDETGIGSWSETEFIEAVKYGKHPEGMALRYPMLPYPLLTDEEAGAIYAYLNTVDPIKNEVKK